MTIKKRLYLTGRILGLILIGWGIYSYLNINNTLAYIIEEIKRYQKMRSSIEERIVDNYRWVQELVVNTMLLNKEFKGELDYTKCRLG